MRTKTKQAEAEYIRSRLCLLAGTMSAERAVLAFDIHAAELEQDVYMAKLRHCMNCDDHWNAKES